MAPFRKLMAGCNCTRTRTAATKTMDKALQHLPREVRAHWAPPPRMLPSEWAEQRHEMPEGSPIPGPFRFFLTLYLMAIVDEIVNRRTRRIVVRKSAHIGFTVA